MAVSDPLIRAPGTDRSWPGRLRRTGRRAFVLVTGSGLCLLGLVLLVLPGW